MIKSAPVAAVACLAGRRIDADDAQPVRFPAHSEPEVREALLRTLVAENVRHLVCSAACGADIIALEVCDECEIPATIVLPFSPAAFRRISVTDRPGDWGPRFDRVLATARAGDTLIELGLSADDGDAFERANETIVCRAAKLQANNHLALIVWDGEKQDGEDITGHIRDLARTHGFRVLEIPTLNQA